MSNSVRISLSLTVNLGNYQSAKVAVDIERDCSPEDEQNELKLLYKDVEDEVIARTNQFVERVLSEGVLS